MVHNGGSGQTLVAIGLCAVAVTGCGNFENPLTWGREPGRQ